MTKKELWDNLMSIYNRYGNKYKCEFSDLEIISFDNEFRCRFYIGSKLNIFTISYSYSFFGENNYDIVIKCYDGFWSFYYEQEILKNIIPIIRGIKIKMLLN